MFNFNHYELATLGKIMLRIKGTDYEGSAEYKELVSEFKEIVTSTVSGQGSGSNDLIIEAFWMTLGEVMEKVYLEGFEDALFIAEAIEAESGRSAQRKASA